MLTAVWIICVVPGFQVFMSVAVQLMVICWVFRQCTRSDKVMRLITKKKKVLFYLFINYNVVTFKVHPLCLHTPFQLVLPLFVVFLECILWDVV